MSGGPPSRTDTCAHCGEARSAPVSSWTSRSASAACCGSGALPLPCPGCGELKVLAFYDADGRPALRHLHRERPCLCLRRLRSRRQPLRAPMRALRGPRRSRAARTRPGDPSALQPVFDALIAGPRPQSALYWLTRLERPESCADGPGGWRSRTPRSTRCRSTGPLTSYVTCLAAWVSFRLRRRSNGSPPWLAGVLAPAA